MMPIIFGIADGVLPKTWLPDIFQSTSMGKLLFNFPPARGKIIIALRSCPYAMHMLWQNDPGVDFKRPVSLNFNNGVTEHLVLGGQELASTIA